MGGLRNFIKCEAEALVAAPSDSARGGPAPVNITKCHSRPTSHNMDALFITERYHFTVSNC